MENFLEVIEVTEYFFLVQFEFNLNIINIIELDPLYAVCAMMQMQSANLHMWSMQTNVPQIKNFYSDLKIPMTSSLMGLDFVNAFSLLLSLVGANNSSALRNCKK